MPIENKSATVTGKPTDIEALRIAQFETAQTQSENPQSQTTKPKKSDLSADIKTEEENPDIYSSPFDIPEVVVTGNRDRGYGSLMNTSGRLAKTYQDVPQTANVITSELLQDMKRFDSFSALTLVPGINISLPIVQGMGLRGFGVSAGFVDGFRVPGNLNSTTNDTAFFDRIEVVKGPASGSFGRGDPAGFINYVTKDPTFRRSTDVDVMFGTGNDDTFTQRYMIDTNGLLTQDGKTAYRLVGIAGNGADTPNLSNYKHNGALLALKRNLTGRGSLAVKMLATEDTIPGTITPLNVVDEDFQNAWYTGLQDQGLPVVRYSLLDRDAWLAYDDTRISNRGFSTTVVFDYKLSEHWSTRQAAKFLQASNDSDLLLNGSYQYAADGVTALNTPLRLLKVGSARSRALQSDFVGQYRIQPIDCTLEVLTGGDYSRSARNEANDFQFLAGQPLATWNPYIELPPWSFNPNDKYYHEVVNNWSVYGQVEAKFWRERVRFTGSWRRNYTDLNGFNTADNSTLTTKSKSPLLPAYSLLFKISEALSVYALYSQYLEPPFSRLLYDRVTQSSPLVQVRGTFQPQTDLTEIGLKGNLLNGRLGVSLSAYDMKQVGGPLGANIFIDDVSQSTDGNGAVTFWGWSSKDTAKGMEFEVFGKITNKLTFMLNGNYVLSSHSMGVFNVVGQPVSIITDKEIRANPNTFAGYATYSATGNRDQGLSVTAGWKTIFSGWEMGGGIAPYPYPHTNTIVDLGVTYGYNDRYKFYVKGNNVFEKSFTVTDIAGTVYGQKFMAGVTAQF